MEALGEDVVLGKEVTIRANSTSTITAVANTMASLALIYTMISFSAEAMQPAAGAAAVT